MATRSAGNGRTIYCSFLPGLSYARPAIPRRPVDPQHQGDALAGNADHFEHRTRGTARDNAGTFFGGQHAHMALAEFAFHGVGNRRAHDRDIDHMTLRVFNAFTNRFGNFGGFAEADADFAEAVDFLEFYAREAPRGLEFHNLKTLFGHALATGTTVIANDPARDPRAGGLPPGHPEMHSFLGIPLAVVTAGALGRFSLFALAPIACLALLVLLVWGIVLPAWKMGPGKRRGKA